MKMKLTEAFRSLGITLRNAQWCWSGKNVFLRRVGVSIWGDRLTGGHYHEVPGADDERLGWSRVDR